MNEEKKLIQKIINDDCFNIFSTIEDKIDLVFVDLPYGQTAIDWDVKIDLHDMWDELLNITTDTCIYAFTCTTKFGHELIASNPSWFSYDLVWEKLNSVGFLSAKKRPLRNHEMIYIFTNHTRDRTIKNLKGREYASSVKKHLNKEDKINIKKDVGWGYISHFFCGPKAYQFSFPNSETYGYLVDNCRLEDMDGYLTYEEMLKLKDINKLNELKTYNPQMTKGKPYKAKASNKKKLELYDCVKVDIDNKGTRYPKSILKFGYDKEKLHPTQKPQGLCEWIIKTYSNPGDLVLDFCAGSGSTALACKNTGRNFICIEKEKKYYDIMCERLKD